MMQPGEVAELRDATQARLASFRKYEALMAERMARPDAASQPGHGVDIIHMTHLRRQIAVLEAAMSRQWPSAAAGSLTADQADAALAAGAKAQPRRYRWRSTPYTRRLRKFVQLAIENQIEPNFAFMLYEPYRWPPVQDNNLHMLVIDEEYTRGKDADDPFMEWLEYLPGELDVSTSYVDRRSMEISSAQLVDDVYALVCSELQPYIRASDEFAPFIAPREDPDAHGTPKFLHVWDPTKPIDFLSSSEETDYVWPWGLPGKPTDVQHGVRGMHARWWCHLWRVVATAATKRKSLEGEPLRVLYGPSSYTRWEQFSSLAFTLRQRRAMIDEVERRYDASMAAGGHLPQFSFRNTVLRPPQWLPGVGSLLYHGTREPKLAHDPQAHLALKSTTFFSLDPDMSLMYAGPHLMAFPLAHELPQPMIRLSFMDAFGEFDGDPASTIDALEPIFGALFGYTQSRFTRTATVIEQLWGTGMVVGMMQGLGSSLGYGMSGSEIIICEPQRYVGAPLQRHFYKELEEATAINTKLDINNRLAAVFLNNRNYDQQLYDALMPRATCLASLEDIMANLVLLQEARGNYTHNYAGVAGTLTNEPVGRPFHRTDMPALEARPVYVHRLATLHRVMVPLFVEVLPKFTTTILAGQLLRAAAGFLRASYIAPALESSQMPPLVLAEREYARFLLALDIYRTTVLGLPTALDVLALDNKLLYVLAPPAP